MKRWHTTLHKKVEIPRADAFIADIIADIIAVCKRHRLWLSHEDNQGAFEITDIREDGWLEAAHWCIEDGGTKKKA